MSNDRFLYIRHFKNGSTSDILKVIMLAVDNESYTAQVNDFVSEFREEAKSNPKAVLFSLWKKIRQHIKYIEDGDNTKLINMWDAAIRRNTGDSNSKFLTKQFIKDPKSVLLSKTADCKSLTVLFFHCCKNLEIPAFIRPASYAKNKVIGHIYPVAVVDGLEAVPIDCVWYRFGAEKAPTYFENILPAVYKDDINMLNAVKTSLPLTNAIGSLTSNWQQLNIIQKIAAAAVGSWLLYHFTS